MKVEKSREGKEREKKEEKGVKRGEREKEKGEGGGERVARRKARGGGGVEVEGREGSGRRKAGGGKSRGELARRWRGSGWVVSLEGCARESRGVIVTMAS
ncbi:hypothetical protein OIV57_34035, partial [Burkholderia pseudomallei]|uniref:hypothetical protein n=1 Tax=Burkholderia pseudomallei TaxID=28450 RepID=UPI0021F748A9